MPKRSLSDIGAPQHPGQFVRETFLTPRRLSVVAAAKLVGVGRPALSNFLNGHVAATPEMAARIEVAFGASAKSLLDMQAAFDAAGQSKINPANAMPYVAPFLGIRANEIEAWVERNIGARIRLPVLLRTLVNSTQRDATKIDFPGNDDAERPGWDGFVEAGAATPWIPAGKSGWEFGANKDINDKANSDFKKSVASNAKSARAEIVFIFVTPRYWQGKADWLKKARAKAEWKDVRAYDAADLEQWLEQSIAAQTWFANETGRPSRDVHSLDSCWDAWANVATPSLGESLFSPAVEGAKQTITSRLAGKPTEPIVIAADSVDEALAFLSQLFGAAGGDDLQRYRDRVLVFKEPGVLPKLAQGTKDFIAVAVSRDVERELGPISRSMHTIVIYPRNATSVSAHVVLEPLSVGAFTASLESSGFDSDAIARYSKESGRSLTVLRRRLANVPAVRTPAWAADSATASSLVPFLLSGAWSAKNDADQRILMELAAVKSYDDVEKICQSLASIDDAPLWSVGDFRGVVSKLDLLFAVAGSLTASDLKRYFEQAKVVLGEDDPKLDLPEDERWAAAIHNKSREHSGPLRRGVAETLVLLAIHGNDLFLTRLGFDCESAVSRLIEGLLTPLKTRTLEANDRDLTSYAEAAPEKFLSIIEKDLRSDHPETYDLMRSSSAGVFGSQCRRSSILWALEGLAWNRATMHRAALILAQLSQLEVNDNWTNKPINSLKSIFRAWMPQTTADHGSRVQVLKLLAERYPAVAWQVCMSQLQDGSDVGHYNHRPVWRNDAHGFGEPFKTRAPIKAFVCEVVDMVLDWRGGYSREMLCDLIQKIRFLSPEHGRQVWRHVADWVADGATDIDRALVREKIRVTALSTRASKWANKAGQSLDVAAAKAAYDALEPTDLIVRHGWLFRQHWIDDFAGAEDADLDYQKREERIGELRTQVLREMYELMGTAGVVQLACAGKTAATIGYLMAERLLEVDDLPPFLTAVLTGHNDEHASARGELISGVLRAMPDDDRRLVLKQLIKELPELEVVRLLMLAPFRAGTWSLVDGLEEGHRENYWNQVKPDFATEREISEAVERLLVARRPRAAFSVAHHCLRALGPELLYRVMADMAKGGNDHPGPYDIDIYSVEQAFALMNKSPELTLDQMASLEFGYVEALAQRWRGNDGYGIPNLEKYVEAHPEFYVQAVVWAYKRDDDAADPPNLVVDPAQAQNFATRGFKLLEGMRRIPGQDDLGVLQPEKLAAWISAVRNSCGELARLDIADLCIGKLLSAAPTGEDGVWPCEPVRQVMEDVHSEHLMSGAHTGLYNSRGATWRGEGGGQERELAMKYRGWADALQYSHPFVASELLINMAKGYEREASREDTEAIVNRRLQ